MQDFVVYWVDNDDIWAVASLRVPTSHQITLWRLKPITIFNSDKLALTMSWGDKYKSTKPNPDLTPNKRHGQQVTTQKEAMAGSDQPRRMSGALGRGVAWQGPPLGAKWENMLIRRYSCIWACSGGLHCSRGLSWSWGSTVDCGRHWLPS